MIVMGLQATTATKVGYLIIVVSGLSLQKGGANALDCTTHSDCDQPREYCDTVMLHHCRPCRDICAPQYVDSHFECDKWCPNYDQVSGIPRRRKNGHLLSESQGKTTLSYQNMARTASESPENERSGPREKCTSMTVTAAFLIISLVINSALFVCIIIYTQRKKAKGRKDELARPVDGDQQSAHSLLPLLRLNSHDATETTEQERKHTTSTSTADSGCPSGMV